MEDATLIKTLFEDPDKGMEILMKKYTGIVAATVKGRLSGFPYCSADIEDCTAETFVKFYTSLASYDPGASCIRTYLCVIARNTAANLTRGMRETDTIDDPDSPIEIPDDSFTEELENRETMNEVISEVKRLGPPDSEIIIRKYYVGQTSKEIAKDLKLTVSNVDTRAHRALEKLRKIFGRK